MSEAIKQLDPQALELVLAKEVEDLTEEDLTSLISHYRAERKAFLLAEATGKKASTSSRKPSAKSEELAKLAEGLELDI